MSADANLGPGLVSSDPEVDAVFKLLDKKAMVSSIVKEYKKEPIARALQQMHALFSVKRTRAVMAESKLEKLEKAAASSNAAVVSDASIHIHAEKIEEELKSAKAELAAQHEYVRELQQEIKGASSSPPPPPVEEEDKLPELEPQESPSATEAPPPTVPEPLSQTQSQAPTQPPSVSPPPPAEWDSSIVCRRNVCKYTRKGKACRKANCSLLHPTICGESACEEEREQECKNWHLRRRSPPPQQQQQQQQGNLSGAKNGGRSSPPTSKSGYADAVKGKRTGKASPSYTSKAVSAALAKERARVKEEELKALRLEVSLLKQVAPPPPPPPPPQTVVAAPSPAAENGAQSMLLKLDTAAVEAIIQAARLLKASGVV